MHYLRATARMYVHTYVRVTDYDYYNGGALLCTPSQMDHISIARCDGMWWEAFVLNWWDVWAKDDWGKVMRVFCWESCIWTLWGWCELHPKWWYIYLYIYIRLYIIMHISYLTTSARGIRTMTLSWKGFQEFHIAVLYGISYYNSNIYITINSLYNAWDAVLNTFTNNNNKCLLLLYWTIRMRSLNFN